MEISEKIREQFVQIFEQVVAGAPNFLYALGLLIVAWVVGKVAQKIIVKGGSKIKEPGVFAKSGVAENEEQWEQIISTFGKLAFYLAFLVVLPGVFDRLGMTSVAQPLSNMTTEILAFMPNLIGAALVFFIALFIAKILREIVTNVLQGLGVDRLSGKLGLTSDESKKKDKVQTLGISKIFGNIVYVLIIIPVTISALEILKIQAISQPAINMLNIIFSYIPNVIAATILILIGVLIARFVGELLKTLIDGSGLNSLVEKYNNELGVIANPNFSISTVIAEFVKILIVIFFIMEAFSVLNLQILQTISVAIVTYIPFLLGAAVTLVGGFLLANFTDKIIGKISDGPKALGKILKYSIIVFAIFMTLDQLRLAPSIVNFGFMAIMAGLGIAFAIAFGLGGREFAAKQLSHLDQKIHETDKENKNKK